MHRKRGNLEDELDLFRLNIERIILTVKHPTIDCQVGSHTGTITRDVTWCTRRGIITCDEPIQCHILNWEKVPARLEMAAHNDDGSNYSDWWYLKLRPAEGSTNLRVKSWVIVHASLWLRNAYYSDWASQESQS